MHQRVNQGTEEHENKNENDNEPLLRVLWSLIAVVSLVRHDGLEFARV